jgi:hypothetical protein
MRTQEEVRKDNFNRLASDALANIDALSTNIDAILSECRIEQFEAVIPIPAAEVALNGIGLYPRQRSGSQARRERILLNPPVQEAY